MKKANKMAPNTRGFNITYTVKFDTITKFEFKKINAIVSYVGYEELQPMTVQACKKLNEDRGSRQAICVLNRNEYNSCLISVQYLLDQGMNLCVIANFRSQHEDLGRPTDEKLLKYLTTLAMTVLEQMGTKVNGVGIVVNVADYHNAKPVAGPKKLAPHLNIVPAQPIKTIG